MVLMQDAARAPLTPDSLTPFTASLVIGAIGLAMTGLAPLATGALHAANALTTPEIGLATTAELLSMGLAAGFASYLIPTRGLHRVCVAAAVLAAGCDIVSPLLAHTSVILCRFAAGLAEGILLWLAIARIARDARPERLSALFLALGVVAQLVMVLAASLVLLPAFGAAGLFGGLAAMNLIAFAAAPFSPDALAPLEDGADGPGPLARLGLLSLVVMFLFSLGTVAVFAYLDPIARAGGLAHGAVAGALTGSLIGQLVGAALAIALAGWVRYPVAFIAATLATLGAWIVYLHPPSALLFSLAAGLTGVGGLFLTPFYVPMSLEADPTRRSATMIGGAQLSGSAVGPVIAAPISARPDLIVALGALCVVLSMAGALMLALKLRKARSHAAV
jgi:hypothetical protein